MKKFLTFALSVIMLGNIFFVNANFWESIPNDYQNYIEESINGIIYAVSNDSDEACVVDIDEGTTKKGVLKIPSYVKSDDYGKLKVTALNTASEFWVYGDFEGDGYIEYCYRDTIYEECDKIILPDTMEYINLEVFGTKEQPVTIVLGKNIKEIVKEKHSHRKTKKQNLYQYIDFEINNNKYFKLDGNFLIEKERPRTIFAYLGGKNIKIPSYIKWLGGFKLCEKIDEIKIPKSITKICANAFEGCPYLKKIVIPKTVKTIENGAFKNCKKVEKITFKTRDKDIKLRFPFEGCDKVESFTVPGRLSPKSRGVCSGMTGLKNVKFAKKFRNEYITDMFQNCSSLEQISLPECITRISLSAFYNCKSLKAIEIPKDVTAIRSTAFSGCSSLEKVEFKGAKLKLLGIGSFRNCVSLKEISLPKSLNRIESSAFAGCASLKTLSFNGDIRIIESWAFDGCETLEEVNFLGKYLTEFKGTVFFNSKSLKMIVISNTSNAPTFENNTFYNANEGLEFYVKNETVAKKLKANLKKVGYTSAKIYANGKLYK